MSAGIDDSKLVAVFGDLNVICWRDGYDREGRPLRLPALGAAAGMVISL